MYDEFQSVDPWSDPLTILVVLLILGLAWSVGYFFHGR
jgi:hypothetical protein